MDGGHRQWDLLTAACLESDEQPAQNEDKAPVSFDGRRTKLVLKLVSQNNIQTNTQINAKCLNCQENSAHLSHLRGRGGHRVWQLPKSPRPWGRKLCLWELTARFRISLFSREPSAACTGLGSAPVLGGKSSSPSPPCSPAGH